MVSAETTFLLPDAATIGIMPNMNFNIQGLSSRLYGRCDFAWGRRYGFAKVREGLREEADDECADGAEDRGGQRAEAFCGCVFAERGA